MKLLLFTGVKSENDDQRVLLEIKPETQKTSYVCGWPGVLD